MATLSNIRPVIYIYGSDTYTAWDTNSLTSIASLPSGASSGTSNAAWKQIPITGAPKKYVIQEPEKRSGFVYANLRIASIEYTITVYPRTWNGTDSLQDTLASVINKRYIYIEQGTYPKPLYTTDATKCMSVVVVSWDQEPDTEHGTLKMTLTLRKRRTKIT